MKRALIVATVGFALAACGGGAGSAEGPWGIGGAGFPDTTDEVAAAMAAMPTEIGGWPLEESAPDMARYGGWDAGPLLAARPAASLREAYGEGWTPEDYLELIDRSGELQVTDRSLDGPVLWLKGTTVIGGETMDDTAVTVLIWAGSDGAHVFTAVAPTEEALGALVEAFLAAG